MWVEWVKNTSLPPLRTKYSPFSDNNNNNKNKNKNNNNNNKLQPQTTPFSPHPRRSISFKDIDSLLLNSPNYPSSPIHKHSLLFPSTPKKPDSARPDSAHSSPARKIPCLKDVHVLAAEPELESDGPAREHHPSVFHRVRAWAGLDRSPPDSRGKVVVYHTSLRVVRATYDDCVAVRSILRGHRVRLDERDLSADAAYVAELKKVSVSKREKVAKKLPRVYVNGKCIGGVDEIKQLQETGALARILRDMPRESGGGPCGACGGCMYVVCDVCDGSRKVYAGKFEGFKSCHVCNVNGLVKCTRCKCNATVF